MVSKHLNSVLSIISDSYYHTSDMEFAPCLVLERLAASTLLKTLIQNLPRVYTRPGIRIHTNPHHSCSHPNTRTKTSPKPTSCTKSSPSAYTHTAPIPDRTKTLNEHCTENSGPKCSSSCTTQNRFNFPNIKLHDQYVLITFRF